MKIELEFTDAQWALIVEHHPYLNDEPVTEASLKATQENDIKQRVLDVMRDAVAHSIDNAFDV